MERKLDYVTGQRDVRSPATYLSAAMARDWSAPEPEPVPAPLDPGVSASAKAWSARREAEEAREAEARAERAVASVRRRRRFEAVEALVARRTPVQRDADRRLFLETLDDEASRIDFRRHGWRSMLDASAIFAFWEDLEPAVFEGLE